MPAAWAFVIQFPTPEELARAGRRRWDKFLGQHGLKRRETYEKRLEIFARADQFRPVCRGGTGRGTAPVTAAKSRLAVAIARQLITLQEQLEQYRRPVCPVCVRTRTGRRGGTGRGIRELFEQHPDHELFGSLPGLADKLAPRMLAECGDDRERFAAPEQLQCVGGTAPVSFASGQMHVVRLRRACNKHLRAAVHLWANLSRSGCAWAEAYYQRRFPRNRNRLTFLAEIGRFVRIPR